MNTQISWHFSSVKLTKGNDEEIYNSSDSGSDTKDKDTSFDSNSEAEFGDNEEISSSSEEEDRNVLQESSTTQTSDEINEDMSSSTEFTASNSDLELAKLVEKDSGSENECIFQSEGSDSEMEEETTLSTILTTESESSEFSEEDEQVIEIDDTNFLATSVANYRRRQIQGLMEVNMPDETETSLGKGKETRKEKTTDKKTNYASLQDMQKIISKSMEKDERKVKENNTKRSVLSKQ